MPDPEPPSQPEPEHSSPEPAYDPQPEPVSYEHEPSPEPFHELPPEPAQPEPAYEPQPEPAAYEPPTPPSTPEPQPAAPTRLAVKPPAKKKGPGCFGCGCLALVVATILLLGLIGVGGYLGYQQLVKLTAPDTGGVPAFVDTFNAYASAQKKISAFDGDVQVRRPSSVSLTADEVNAILFHDPIEQDRGALLFVTLDGDKARLQASLPSGLLLPGALSGRYFNLDSRFTLRFDAPSRGLRVDLQSLQAGGRDLIANPPGKPLAERLIDRVVTDAFRRSPPGGQILDQAKTFTVRDGHLIIETQ